MRWLYAKAVPTINVTLRSGENLRIEARGGQPLMRALVGGGITEIEALCGGGASCGTCHVYVGDGWLERLPPPSCDEEELLGFSDWRRANSRLSCQIRFDETLDGISVTVAPED